MAWVLNDTSEDSQFGIFPNSEITIWYTWLNDSGPQVARPYFWPLQPGGSSDGPLWVVAEGEELITTHADMTKEMRYWVRIRNDSNSTKIFVIHGGGVV